MVDTQGGQFEACKLHENKVRKQICFFYYVAGICTITKGKDRYGLV